MEKEKEKKKYENIYCLKKFKNSDHKTVIKIINIMECGNESELRNLKRKSEQMKEELAKFTDEIAHQIRKRQGMQAKLYAIQAEISLLEKGKTIEAVVVSDSE